MKLLKHSGKIIRHRCKIMNSMCGGSIKHLISKSNGGNINALKQALGALTMKPKKISRIKF